MSDKIELHIDKVEVVADDYDYVEEHIKKMSALYNGKSAFENYQMAREINKRFIKHVLQKRDNSW